jgi:hypothetical protein
MMPAQIRAAPPRWLNRVSSGVRSPPACGRAPQRASRPGALSEGHWAALHRPSRLSRNRRTSEWGSIRGAGHFHGATTRDRNANAAPEGGAYAFESACRFGCGGSQLTIPAVGRERGPATCSVEMSAASYKGPLASFQPWRLQRCHHVHTGRTCVLPTRLISLLLLSDPPEVKNNKLVCVGAGGDGPDIEPSPSLKPLSFFMSLNWSSAQKATAIQIGL